MYRKLRKSDGIEWKEGIILNWFEKELGGRVFMWLFIALMVVLVLVLLTIGGICWSIKDNIATIREDLACIIVAQECVGESFERINNSLQIVL